MTVIPTNPTPPPTPPTWHAEPYDARLCPVCETWIYVADGPFAEGDPTKPLADFNHWRREHATEEEKIPGATVTFPFFDYNDEPVEAVVE